MCFVIMYYNIDKLLQTLYLPYVKPTNNYELITNHEGLYFLLNMTSYFMLGLYTYIFSYRLFISKIADKNSIGLSFIYIKHLRDILISPNYTIMEYELNRGVMCERDSSIMYCWQYC
jgi:hypothetical protein